MANRYLVFVPDEADADRTWQEAVRALGLELGFRILERDQVVLISEAAVLDLNDTGNSRGVIVGSLFRRSDNLDVMQFSASEARALDTIGSASLVQHFWGNYIAVMSCRHRGVEIMRAPFGDLACYHCGVPGGRLIASDLDLLRRASGIRPRIDWTAVAMHLVAPDIRRSTTCLHDIAELPGGDSLSLGTDAGQRTLWTPWAFVAPERRCDDSDRAAAMVAHAVCSSVAAQTRQFAGTVLLLSGGLDSSIVAASLSRARRFCTALTMVTHAAGGDEREQARAAASHCGIDLREVVRDVAMVDVTRSAAAGLPYPSERSFSQATAAAALAVARETGAEAVVHGGGGDNIFCALQSAAPLADLIRARGLDGRAATLTHDIAANAQATSGAVVKQAVARLLWRSPRYHWEPKTGLLSPAGLAHRPVALTHPWLDPPRGALPGAAGHIGLVLGALSVVQSPSARAPLPWRAVLVNQPVIETCLSIPSWLWFERGRNRAIARRAFSSMLPDPVAWRPSKGAMDSFIVEIFEANRARLKPMLIDGMLARSGLIDRQAIVRLLDDPGPVKGREFGRIMQFADVEAWLASWR